MKNEMVPCIIIIIIAHLKNYIEYLYIYEILERPSGGLVLWTIDLVDASVSGQSKPPSCTIVSLGAIVSKWTIKRK